MKNICYFLCIGESLLRVFAYICSSQQLQRSNIMINTISATFPILVEQGKNWVLAVELCQFIIDNHKDFMLRHDAALSQSLEEEKDAYMGDYFIYVKLSGTCDEYSDGTSAYVEKLEVIDEDNNTIEFTDQQEEQIKKAITQLNVQA